MVSLVDREYSLVFLDQRACSHIFEVFCHDLPLRHAHEDGLVSLILEQKHGKETNYNRGSGQCHEIKHLLHCEKSVERHKSAIKPEGSKKKKDDLEHLMLSLDESLKLCHSRMSSGKCHLHTRPHLTRCFVGDSFSTNAVQ